MNLRKRFFITLLLVMSLLLLTAVPALAYTVQMDVVLDDGEGVGDYNKATGSAIGIYDSDTRQMKISGHITKAPSREGYTWVGYTFRGEQVPIEEWSYGGTTEYFINTTYNNYEFVMEQLVFVAQWTENTATLTYNANGHGTAPDAVPMKYTAATNAAAALAADGFTFNGWNTKADGSGTAYAAGALFKNRYVEPVDTTLYAQWTANKPHIHDGVTFSTQISTLEQLQTLFANGGSGYLAADIIASGTTNVTISGKNVALCLNGHTLQEVSTAITDKGTYSLYDCTGTGKLSSVLETWHNGAAISVSTGGTFNLYSGTITGWRAVGVGSGVYVADATSIFNMHGGSIEYGKTTYKNRYGGGVYLNGGRMTMSGGTIRNNTLTSKAHGGGIYVRGGYVEWDGESVPSTAQFVMTGGEIKDNYADWSGGGIMLEAGGSFLMTGGTISGNTSGAYGKGIAIYDGDTTSSGRSWAYIKGGTISGNSIERSVGGRVTVESQNVTLDNAYFTGTYAYTIDYDANGGTDAPASKMGYIAFNDTANAKYVLPTSVPTRNGYNFEDWYTAPSGGTKVTGESIVSSIFEKQTLYAQWTEHTATLTYDANCHGTAPNAVTMKYTQATNAAAIEADGFVFKGWNTKADGTGTAYAAGAQIKAANVDPVATTLYAQWNKKTNVPTVSGDKDNMFLYTGNEITALSDTDAYTVTGGSATEPGKYTATLTLKPGYVWANETYDAKTVDWYIVNTEYYLITAPTLSENGTYNQRSYYINGSNEKVPVENKLLGDDVSIGFADWYLRTMVQYKMDGDNYDIRFISMLNGDILDSEKAKLPDYDYAGFTVKLNGQELTPATTYEANTSFLANGEEISISDYSRAVDYFFLANTLIASDIVNDNSVITVTPFVKLMNGTTVEGKTVTFTIGQLKGN